MISLLLQKYISIYNYKFKGLKNRKPVLQKFLEKLKLFNKPNPLKLHLSTSSLFG